MSEANELDIDTLRSPSELPHHWKLRREFLNVHKGEFDHDRLVSLSHLFVNIKCLGLEYPQEVMDNIEKLSKPIDTKLIDEATVEESYKFRDNEINCDDSQQQQHRPQYNQQSSRHNHTNNYNNNNNHQSRQTSSPFGRGRPRYQQSNHYNDNRHQSYQQPAQSYQQQQPQGYQQQHQPQQFARYSEQPSFFRPQELRAGRSDRQGLGARQSPYQPRHQRGGHRGGSGGSSWRT